jgi:hypothetical protein
MNREARLLLFVSCVGIALLGASPAFAFDYTGDPFVSPNYTFDLVSETTDIITDNTDPEPLFGDNGANAPSVAGDSLVFDPLAAFSATSLDGTGPVAGMYDITHSTLNLEITANAVGTPIDTITFTETGTMNVVGAGASTGVAPTLGGGTVRVTEQNGVAIAAVIIAIPFDGFSLLGVDTNGTVSWQLTSVVDVASAVPGATRVEIAIDNDLQAYSFDGPGYSATISKDSLSISLPEPTTVSLMALGLLGAVWSGRRSRE